jgi:hypothetical protein
MKKSRKEYMHQWYLENKERILIHQKEYSQKHKKEINLHKHKYFIKKYYNDPDFHARVLKRGKEKILRERILVLTHYGGNPPKCACCGESYIEFLAIDHINGGGSRHLKELRIKGQRFYEWLIKNNFPVGFRVLCHNCNMSLGLYGYCPHRFKKKKSLDTEKDSML